MASIVIALNVAYDIDDVRPWWLRDSSRSR